MTNDRYQSPLSERYASKEVLCTHLKFCKFGNYIYQFCLHKIQRFCHEDYICIISHITRGCSQMNDSLCFRTLLTISIYMRHYVMADDLLAFLCHFIVNVLCMFFQFVNLLLSDGKSQFLLSLSKRNPKFSPCAELLVR